VYDEPPGFRAPVFQCLLWKRTKLGAPQGVTLITFALAGVALIWSWWPLFPALGLLQGAAALGTWLDEDWFEIWPRVLRYHKHYEP